MIVWLNGPFGAGKTTVAREVVARLPGSIFFDPEQIGFLLRRSLATLDPHDDFQGWSSWRDVVVATLSSLDRHYPGPLVVPQTVLVEAYWEEVAEGLRLAGVTLLSFTLHVDEKTLRRRIRYDWVEVGAARWRREHVVPYRDALPWLRQSGTVLDTTNLNAVQVAERVRAITVAHG